MVNNFIYKNPPDSGLGDRLLDIITLYSYSQFLNYKNFYLHWKYSEYCRPSLETKYLFHYIKFPENIHFVSQEEINRLCENPENFCFEDILSATSLFLFKDNYIQIDDHEAFDKFYFASFNNIKLINIPTEIIKIFEDDKNIITTIHLRRSDKVNNVPGAHGVSYNELEYLNSKTKEFIEEEIKKSNIICFISDDTVVKNEYINLYKNRNDVNIIFFNHENEAIQTYYDYYCLLNSDNIFMSQKFSTFSITASLIKNNILYYCFDYGRMFDYDNINYCFNKYSNFIKF